MTQSKVLILQHVPWEKPGRILDSLDDLGMSYEIANVAKEKKPDLPDFKEISGVVIMGGPMGALDFDKYPGLKAEGKLARAAVSVGKPVLGVCLGHQVLGHCAGATVEKGARPMHGKVTRVHHRGTGLFAGLPEEFNVTRYHSLVVREDTLPADYQVDCVADDGTVMALSHRTLPMYGVQFHPEAVLTEYGHEMLENFCRMAEEKGVSA